jgi:hypothetical protein
MGLQGLSGRSESIKSGAWSEGAEEYVAHLQTARKINLYLRPGRSFQTVDYPLLEAVG